MRWPPPSDWPNVARSKRVFCAPHRWHVQLLGEGADLLLLHGAGGSTHSFRDLIPLLAKHHRVIALDLPGQGFTQLGARHRCGLDATVTDIAALIRQEGWAPAGIIGHSAGAAVGLSLVADDVSPRGQPPRIVGINPALDNFEGLAGALFPALAKILAAVPFTAQAFASLTATPARVQSLISSTGSNLDADGLSFYRRLISDRDHVDATLLMMANWPLDTLNNRLFEITAPTLFIVGEEDRTVPPRVSDKAASRMPNAHVSRIAGAGHLVHEEQPQQVARLILDWLDLSLCQQGC
ncbi:MAG: alpha/beta fold hydrolase BchO [Pseudomonadota bacterium]